MNLLYAFKDKEIDAAFFSTNYVDMFSSIEEFENIETETKVLYSEEKPIDTSSRVTEEEKGAKRSLPGSIAFVPPVAGLMIAGKVIRELAGVE